MSRPKVIYHPRPNSTPEAELDALSAVYALALRRYYESKGTAEPAPESDSCNDAAMVRNTEEVRHVEQRHDRSSDDHIASGTLAARVSDSQKYRESLVQKECISSD